MHEMQVRSSNENSVRLFVCLSVKHVYCDKMEEKLSRFFWLVGRPLLPEILGQPALFGAKSPILN